MSKLTRRDFTPAQPLLAVKKLLAYLDDAAAVSNFQAVAATAVEQVILPAGTTGISAITIANGDVASGTEDITVDISRVRAGVVTSMLSAVIVVDSSIVADSVTDFSSSIDSAVLFADGDVLQISRTYTAGTPTPMTNTIVKVTPS